MEEGSLSYMVSVLDSEFGFLIGKQSLNERFNEKCVCYIKAVLSEVIEEQFEHLYSKALLPGFKRIRIKDSTKFMAPPGLETNYKSCGGGEHSRSRAGVSIQYEYDIKSGAIIDLNITSGNRNDRTDATETADRMENGDLIIRDLGYFSTPVLENCMERDAFFLSRLDSTANVYDTSGQLISFKHIYRKMQKQGRVDNEMFVYIGKKTKLPVRLILQLVPEEVYSERIRKKSAKSKGQGRGVLREETKIRSRFNLFITNADETLLPVRQIFPIYKLRWQIELQFKVWKSVFKIDHLQKMKEHRYITLLYVKLLLIIINLQITYSLQRGFSEHRTGKIRILSLNKSLKTLRTLSDEIFAMFRQSRRKAKETVRYIINRLSENHWLECKKKKLCFPSVYIINNCYLKKKVLLLGFQNNVI
jgi:hypothetical protein